MSAPNIFQRIVEQLWRVSRQETTNSTLHITTGLTYFKLRSLNLSVFFEIKPNDTESNNMQLINNCYVFVPCIVIQLCNVNQQNALFKLMF